MKKMTPKDYEKRLVPPRFQRQPSERGNHYDLLDKKTGMIVVRELGNRQSIDLVLFLNDMNKQIVRKGR